MDKLILGLVLFFITHIVPSFPGIREKLVGKLKLTGYKSIFNLMAIVSILLIVYGLKEASFQQLYVPPNWGRPLAMLLMLPAIYCFLSNSNGPAPSSIKTITAHPLNWGIILWSVSHLLANGDLAHVLLFGTLLLFCAISIVTGNARGLLPKLKQRPPLVKEAIFITIVVVIYGALVWGHQHIVGVSIVGV